MARRDKNSQRDPHGLAPWVKEVVRLFGDGSVVGNLIHHPGKLDGVWVSPCFCASLSTSFTIHTRWMGSPRDAEAVRGFLERRQVLPLFSPPRTLEYNGSIEAGNGAVKTHIHQQAARQGRGGHWTADGLEAARRMANELVYPDGPRGPTRHGRFRSAPCVPLEARAAFGYSVASRQTAEREKLGHPSNTDLSHMAQAQIDRVAIGCALVEHGHLTVTGRSITPPIKTLIPLGIS